MATSLHRVRQNFVWKLEGLTPTNTRGTLRTQFRDLNGTPPGQATGTARGFEVRRLRRGKSDEPTDGYRRIADHEYQVEIYYPGELKTDAIDEVTSQDSHDIIKALRASASWIGYDATHTTDDIGIMERLELGDELLSVDGRWILRLRFQVKVKEIEYA